MSDVYATGWKAALNNQPIELHRANYAYRAVFVPPGEHDVMFVYQPWDFQLGRALSWLGLISTAVSLSALFLTGNRKRRLST